MTLVLETPAAVVEEYWSRWAARDKAAALQLVSDEITYALYVPEDVLPFGGVTSGKPSISDRLQTILDVFHTVRFAGRVTKSVGDIVHGHVEYCFRHKITGHEIDGTMRQVIRIEDGRIIDWREYADVERVRAFMRLVAYAASPDDAPGQA